MFQCDQYFEYVESVEVARVKIVTIYLEGKALQWHQSFLRSRLGRGMPKWDEYVAALSVRFGNDLYYDPMVELMNHKQLGSVQTYLEMFEEILSRCFYPKIIQLAASWVD